MGAPPHRDPERALAGAERVVLLVQDEAGVRERVQRELVARGWTAVAAAHAEDAIGLVAVYGGKVDAVVADVVMPRMSGRAFVERLRQAIPHLRVVFVSSQPERHGEALDRERTAYLRRPFTVEELDRTLRSLLAAS